MRRLTIMRASGDPDQLLAAKREHIDPVMERRAGEYGHISHVAARTPDGMIVINLWESAEGSEQAFQDPEVQAAREAMNQSGASAGPPEVEHYEVEDYRHSQGG
jgi:heme-degrading monooxygenase HmoA